LAPIHLDLLGLHVDTSAICLQITAYQGGGLLGNLLCQIAHLLDGGLNLDQILAGAGLPRLPGLTGAQIQLLTSGLTNLLNQALAQLLGAILANIIDALPCDILHLELGPLNLNLLGLQVILDNCEGGAVTVDLTADPAGGLLGQLLCGLLGGLDLSQTLASVLHNLGL